MNRCDITTDVAVVGGGLSGCLAAKVVVDLGYAVIVFDRSADPPHEFRAEQIVGAQIDRLRSLGVLDAMIRDGVGSATTVNLQRGVVVDRTRVDQFGVAYRSMVVGARSVLPPASLCQGRVTAIEPTREGSQIVVLADGRRIGAKLVLVATGLLPHVLERLGVGWSMVSKSHSLCFGFDLAIEQAMGGETLPLISYGERAADKIDYLALFAMGDALRVNLFAYQDLGSAWTHVFLADPQESLRDAMPGFARLVGPCRISSPVQARSIDIRVATNVVREGVVVVGDAYQTPCPAAGTGIDRILSDIDALSRWLPLAMPRPSIGAPVVSRFYEDAAKQAFDKECIRIAMYRRAFSTEQSLSWRLHRYRVFLQRRIRRLYGPGLLPTVYGRMGHATGTRGKTPAG